MGKFSDKILDMLKNQDMNKSSCLKRGIYVLISLITIAIVTIFAVVHTVNQSNANNDLQKFFELVNKYYEDFTPNVTKEHEINFKEYVLSSTQLLDGELYTNENFNMEGFLSTNLMVDNGFRLNFFDLAVLLNYHWADDVLSVERVETSYYDLKVEWAVLVCVDLNSLVSGINMTKNSVPSKVYVLFKSKVNLQKTWNEGAVESFDVQVNRLTGEDNDFATRELCSLLKLTNKKLCEYAIYPFAFAKTQAVVWGKNFSFCEDCSFEYN